MAYTSGEASTLYDVFEALDTLLLGIGWVQHDTKYTTGSTPRLCQCIWEGKGDGSDRIYIQGKMDDKTFKRIAFDGCAGYDEHLEFWEQPGSIQQWLKVEEDTTNPKQPVLTATYNEKFYYWIFADTYRFVIVCRMSIVYESCYVGFINPIASERQYPYPMYVAGNGTMDGGIWPDNKQGSFVFPKDGSGYLRRADGTWREFLASFPNPDADSQGTLFPYDAHNTQLIPNYKEQDAINQDNFLLIPIMLHTSNPTDVNGILRGCYWVSGTRDIDAERVFTFNGVSYIAFDTKQARGNNTYFCVKME